MVVKVTDGCCSTLNCSNWKEPANKMIKTAPPVVSIGAVVHGIRTHILRVYSQVVDV
jgi:hypothetical protein